MEGGVNKVELKQVQYRRFFLINRVLILLLLFLVLLDSLFFNFIESTNWEIIGISLAVYILLYKIIYGFCINHYKVVGKIQVFNDHLIIDDENYKSDIKFTIRSIEGDSKFWQIFFLYFYLFFWPKTSMGVQPDGISYIKIKDKKIYFLIQTKQELFELKKILIQGSSIYETQSMYMKF